jgi:hypothetical protein
VKYKAMSPNLKICVIIIISLLDKQLHEEQLTASGTFTVGMLNLAPIDK